MARGSNNSDQTAIPRSRPVLPEVPVNSFNSSVGAQGFLVELHNPDDKAWYVEYLRQRVIETSLYKTGTIGQLERQGEAVTWAWKNGASEEELGELSGLSIEDIRDHVYESAYESGRQDALTQDDY